MVNVAPSKTNTRGTFAIASPGDDNLDYFKPIYNFYHIRVKLDAPYFLMQVRNGNGTKQRIGDHRIGDVPKIIAKFLKLENYEDYTGHS